MENGISMEEIDRMDFGAYMEILSEHARREDARQDDARRDGGKGATVYRRGTIDEIW